MKELFSRLIDFWSSDRSLTAFLVMLVIMLFVIYPLGNLDLVSKLLINTWFSLILILGVLTAVESLWLRIVVIITVFVTLLVRWMDHTVPSIGLTFLSTLLTLISVGMLATIVLIEVFREGPITAHRLQGAVAVYLLLGIMWGFAYWLVDLQVPDAFVAPSLGVTSGESLHQAALMYFSFETLTTVGYGDIIAVHPVARTLVMGEALTGQLYLAILIARLVSLELAYRRMK